MNYLFTQEIISTCNYSSTYSPDRDSHYPALITIGKGNTKNWQYSFTHELAHALSTKLKEKYKYESRRQLFKRELITWRLAKSFCRDKYINDDWAIECLKSYAEWLEHDVDWGKLKIIPLNTNKWLADSLSGK